MRASAHVERVSRAASPWIMSNWLVLVERSEPDIDINHKNIASFELTFLKVHIP